MNASFIASAKGLNYGNLMKDRISTLSGMAALVLAFLTSHASWAQSTPQPVAPMTTNSIVAPPTLLPGMDPNSPFGQVIRMVQTGAAQSAIFANIASSSVPFNATAVDLGYLNDLGAPASVKTALLQREHELGANPQVSQPQTALSGTAGQSQDVTEDYFYGALAPYGTWINIPGYGLCWQPCAAIYNPGWTPYCTLGQWLYTDYGWYWLSGYSWGWCVFHYGRWFHDPQHGWCWWPSTTWAPSWVFWRYSGAYCGWAPLPPHCYYSEENGLVYNGASVASDYDFGMGANLFTFVPMANLCDADTERLRLPAAQAGTVFGRSTVLADINSNDRIIANDGIPVSRIAATPFTGGKMHSFTIRPAESVALPGTRGEQILPDGETLAINRPYFNVNVPSALKQGIWPIPGQQQPVAHQPPTFIVNQIPYSYPSADDQNKSVIYVDTAAQNGPPVPTVTTEGPQDYAAPAPAPAVSGESYWSVYAEAPAPVVDTSSEYISPRQRSHEHWRHRTRQPDNHREFNPPPNGSQPADHHEGHAPEPDQRHINVQLMSPNPNQAPSQSHSSSPNAPAHDAPGSPPPDHHPGR
jgi:hypothetical protein